MRLCGKPHNLSLEAIQVLYISSYFSYLFFFLLLAAFFMSRSFCYLLPFFFLSSYSLIFSHMGVKFHVHRGAVISTISNWGLNFYLYISTVYKKPFFNKHKFALLNTWFINFVLTVFISLIFLHRYGFYF